MCGVIFLTLLAESSCWVLRASSYTMGLQLVWLIYGSACVCPVKLSYREVSKPLKMVWSISLKLASLHSLTLKSCCLAVLTVP